MVSAGRLELLQRPALETGDGLTDVYMLVADALDCLRAVIFAFAVACQPRAVLDAVETGSDAALDDFGTMRVGAGAQAEAMSVGDDRMELFNVELGSVRIGTVGPPPRLPSP